MVNEPSLLGLPLETRQHIYSHCLINNRVLDMVTDDMHHLARGLLRTCRQLNREVADFYYARNTFQISLISAHYNAKERGRTTFLENHLIRVRNLRLVIRTEEVQRESTAIGDVHVFFSIKSQFPKQQQQWYWFVDTLARVKERQEGLWLSTLKIRDSGLDDSVLEREPLKVLGEEGNEVVAPYSFLLESLSERIGRIEIEQLSPAQEMKLEADEVAGVVNGVESVGDSGPSSSDLSQNARISALESLVGFTP
jgi:hypothetical protein